MKNQDIDLRSLVAVLRRQLRAIVYSFILIFGLAAVFLMAATPEYTATGLVLVDPSTKNLLEQNTGFPSSASNENSRVDSEVEILRSSAVGLGVVKAENLIADPEFGPRLRLREKLARAVGIAQAAQISKDLLVSKTLASFKHSLNIRRKGLTYLISVSVSSTSPERAAKLANAVAQTYIDQQVQFKISETLAARDILQSQITTARNALADSEGAFDTFVANRISRFKSHQNDASIENLNAGLTDFENKISATRQTQSEVRVFLASQSWESLALELGDQATLRLENERQVLARKLSSISETGGFTFDLAEQLEQLETRLAEKSELILMGLSQDIQRMENKATSQRAKIRKAILNTDLPPDLLTEIYAVQQDATIARTQYQNLLSRLRDIEIQSRIQVADSRLVSPALAPINASFPNRNLVLLAALAAAMGIGVSAAFLNEYYIGGITSANQLSEVLQTPTAATIPHSVERNEQRLSIAEHVVDAPLSAYAESIRKLRAGVDQALRSTSNSTDLALGKTILVTSSLPREGKTTTSLALARTYALAGKNTLLIDADLRLPAVHKQLGFEPKLGVLDFLKNPTEIAVSNAFYARDSLTSLALILGSGRSDMPTDQLLNSETFSALIQQARDVYDVIIIDSPPVLPVVDARYIAHHADAVVMVVRWAVTSQNDLRAAVQPLRAAMQPDAAFLPVLGQQESRGSAQRYSGYYGDYSAAI